MPSTTNHPTYFPRRVNCRVPNLAFHSEVDVSGLSRMELGVPATASANSIISAQDVSVAVTKGGVFTAAYLANPASVLGPYGRNLVFALSGAGTPTVTIRGRDYLGQPISEAYAATGATPVVGKKAFASVDNITLSAVVAATTISVGTGLLLGLPFATTGIDAELVDDAIPTAGALTYAATTTTQTITSNDPRGMYTPNAAPNSARSYVLLGWTLPGQLHGVAHFSS
jgi:hypothetical protein